MSQICILTDGAVQFTGGSFQGVESVNMLPFQAQLEGQPCQDAKNLRLGSLPVSVWDGQPPRISPPSSDDFYQAFMALGRRYHEVIVILTSARLSSTFVHAQEAAEIARCPANLF
jgi:fatty acid-binding protein DegV